jgi:hypothetical protein
LVVLPVRLFGCLFQIFRELGGGLHELLAGLLKLFHVFPEFLTGHRAVQKRLQLARVARDLP